MRFFWMVGDRVKSYIQTVSSFCYFFPHFGGRVMFTFPNKIGVNVNVNVSVNVNVDIQLRYVISNS